MYQGPKIVSLAHLFTIAFTTYYVLDSYFMYRSYECYNFHFLNRMVHVVFP